jgi:hypothetical protein
MAIGTYGLTIPMHFKSGEIANMVEIYYVYHATRSYDNFENKNFKKLDPNILKPATREFGSQEQDNVLEGMYNLHLPMAEFSRKGFYTIYIKPKEVKGVITDVGSLSAYPGVRGIILDSSKADDAIRQKLATNNGLVGYRVIFMDDSNERRNEYRIVTSNNKCEPLVMVPNSSSDKSYSYRYNESSSLVFLTLSPSAAPNFKSNATPFIGKPTQEIILVNTFFKPIMIDLEMVEHDADTISMMIENSQLRNLDNGLVSTFNDNNEIYHQAEHFTLKDQYTGKPVYEVKEKRTNNIDFTQTINDKL